MRGLGASRCRRRMSVPPRAHLVHQLRQERGNMNRFFAALAAVLAVVIITVPVATADLTGDLLQSALNDLVAWDPGFAPFADPPPDGHEYVVGSHKVTLGN